VEGLEQGAAGAPEQTQAGLEVGDSAPNFQGLRGVDGRLRSLSDFEDKAVLVLVFTGNGCPAAKASEDRLISLQRAYGPQSVQLVAINSNNPYLSPPDTFAEMVKHAAAKGWNFPYLKDEDGRAARAFGAVSTPHVFVLDRHRRLRYQGRIDDSRDPSRVTVRDLQNALDDLLAGRPVRVPQTIPFGCSIVR
jgi:peroxiredoxin